jgi:hypothetical protein
MSIKLSVTSNIQAFADRQVNLAKQFDFAGVVALTRTAQQIKLNEIDEMRTVFDRPTPFTLNSLQVRPATKTNREAEVSTKLGFGSVPAGRYLNPEVEGGHRSMKSHELKLGSFTIPSEFEKLNKYGNLPAPRYIKILSQLQLLGENSATGSRRSKRKRQTEAFFRRGNVIYSRTSRHSALTGKASKSFESVFPVLILTKAPSYRPRFPFYDIAQDTTDRLLEVFFDKALAQAWATAK